MILMNDFKAEPPELKAAMAEAARRVIDSGWYVLGREVEVFEKRWAQALNVPHALGVGNGLDAIELALRALDIGAGDEVITTPMTAFATVLAVLRAGAVPVLADIDPQTGLLDPASAERCIGARTRAIVLVHLYGQVRQMDRWLEGCRQHDLHLVEDCAQAHLARSGERCAGTFGALGAYSFYPTKNLGAIGDAGAVVTTDARLAERVARLRNYGQRQRYHHPELGMNSRLDEMQAALLSVRLDWLAEFTDRRRAIAAQLADGIRHPQVRHLAPPEQPQAHVHHLFAICCEQRDRLQQHLAAQGVQALIHYPVPIHHQPPCTALRTDPQGLPHTEAHARNCLSLPCHPQMSAADVDQVIAAVNSFRSD